MVQQSTKKQSEEGVLEAREHWQALTGWSLPERAALEFIAECWSSNQALLDAAKRAELLGSTLEQVLAPQRGIDLILNRTPGTVFNILLREGMPAHCADVLTTDYEVPLSTVADWLFTSTKTLKRWRDSQDFMPRDTSDIAVRYGRVFRQAVAAFGDNEEAARQWLTSPQSALGGAVPTELLATELGARDVERVLELIDYGEYL